jgi:hypothetical protein
VETEPLIYRDEVRGMLFAIADLNIHVEKILRLLQEEFGGEEGLEEEDS